LIYLELNPKMDNNKYVENEFVLPRPPKRKHTMENVPAPKPTYVIEVDDEEEDEDSGGLDHISKSNPTNRVDIEHMGTPPHAHEEDEELDVEEFQGECHFKRVFKRTRKQGMGTPHLMMRSPQLSPQKEAIENKIRKLKLNDEVEESTESTLDTNVQLEYVEEPKDEDLKDEEEG
ncbi:hypothetical protein KI387_028360, partial [Taxus chinensis]